MMGGPPEKIFMSSDKDENELIILEYSDSSRFILTLTASVGARMLEKEMMEVFTPGGGISLRNFIDMKVRGIHGEKDYLFMPDRFPRNDLIQRWGYLAWELFTSKFAEPDLPINPNLVPIVPAQEELPFLPEIEKELLPLKDSPWQERCYFPDKGWTDAFRHFAKACLEGTCPLTADGSAGKLASDLGSALMRSAEKGMFLPFRPEKP